MQLGSLFHPENKTLLGPGLVQSKFPITQVTRTLWFSFQERRRSLNLRANLYPCPSSAEIIKLMGLFPLPKNRAAKKISRRENCLLRPERMANTSPPGGSQGCASTGSRVNHAARALLCLSLLCAWALTSFCLPPWALVRTGAQITQAPGPFCPVSEVRVHWLIV